MLKSSGAMFIATLISRVLGMVREMVYSAFMGAGPVAGAFFLAYTIPNLFRRLLGEGALTAAFIPIFKSHEKDEKSMWHVANAAISGLIIVCSVIVGITLIGLTLFISFLKPSAETELMLRLLRIMFPYLLLVCLTAVLMAMLNSRGKFFLPAMGATALNVVTISVVLFVAPHWGVGLPTQIYALAYGVLVAGFFQVAIQIPALLKEGFRPKWISKSWQDPAVKEIWRKMIPGMLGVAAYQINILVTKGIAFKVDPTIVATFDYAVRLMELPQGLFAVSLATFLLPALSGLAAEKKFPEFRSTLSEGLGHLMFINLFASVVLMVLAEPIVRLLFERGKFDSEDTFRCAQALAFLGPGLLAYSMVNIVARAFYALGDTHTPMRISIFCLFINLFLALWMIGPFRQVGLAAANSMSAWTQWGLLLYAFKRKMPKSDFTQIWSDATKIGALAVGAGVLAWSLKYQLVSWLVGTPELISEILMVFVPAGAAFAFYFGMSILLKIKSPTEISDIVVRKIWKTAK